ncbi:MAG TPA: bifunctional pyr operon transcriptional regulator/uracil phosphoribosyltransferase PyrR [Vicinamibacteria bacterium]|jgi:pyrimidine operon attenuation protein/uracil phosphoribosyltransferase
MKSKVIMDRETFQSVIDRLASEIVERTRGIEGLALVGIRTRGVPLARRLAQGIESRTGAKPSIGALDITLYRDDLTAAQPIVRKTELPFAMDDAWVVLVDDVLFTGRTVRAAITALIDFGRPKKIELLVMVDRGWRELPIQADYAGKTLRTAREDTVQVLVSEEDGRDEVVLLENGSA